jgi:hypothetical protein
MSQIDVSSPDRMSVEVLRNEAKPARCQLVGAMCSRCRQLPCDCPDTSSWILK